MAKTDTDTGRIKAGEKSFTVNKNTIKFDVPNDIEYKYSWTAVEEGDIALESEHVTAKEVIDAVNTVRKNTARQTAYMGALAPYKPDTMSPEDRLENAKRQLLQAGVPQELVEQTLAAMKSQIPS